MSNMSHCIYRNCSSDLQQAIDDIDTRLNNNGQCEHNEDLSRDEENALYELIEQARYYADTAEELFELLEDKKH